MFSSDLLMQASSGSSTRSAPADSSVLWVKDLAISDRHGNRLLGPVSFAARRGEVVALTGGTTVQRALLAAAVTGRLHDRSHRVSGVVLVDGSARARRIRKYSALLQVRLHDGAADETPRALADLRVEALTRAGTSSAGLIAVSPGVEDLDLVEATRLAWSARHVADHGHAVIVSTENTVQVPTADRIVDLAAFKAAAPAVVDLR